MRICSCARAIPAKPASPRERDLRGNGRQVELGRSLAGKDTPAAGWQGSGWTGVHSGPWPALEAVAACAWSKTMAAWLEKLNVIKERGSGCTVM
jgi:hypothetical protein